MKVKTLMDYIGGGEFISIRHGNSRLFDGMADDLTHADGYVHVRKVWKEQEVLSIAAEIKIIVIQIK